LSIGSNPGSHVVSQGLMAYAIIDALIKVCSEVYSLIVLASANLHNNFMLS